MEERDRDFQLDRAQDRVPRDMVQDMDLLRDRVGLVLCMVVDRVLLLDREIHLCREVDNRRDLLLHRELVPE